MYPAVFKMPVAQAAEKCNWRLKVDRGRLMVRPMETYYSRPGLLFAERLPANEISKAASLDITEQWGFAGRTLGDLSKFAPGLRDQMAKTSSVESFLGHFRNLLAVTPEASLGSDLAAGWDAIQRTLPAASLWKMPTNSSAATRVSLINGLFASSETPEIFTDPEAPPSGFEAGRGFIGQYMYGLGFLLEPYLLAASPYSLGWVASRLGGAYVVLFGEARRDLGTPAATSLLALHRPHAIPGWLPPAPQTPPALSAVEIERGFLWWTVQLDKMLSLLLDPRWYADSGLVHDPILQIATMLAAAQLFTTVQAILAEPPESHIRLGFFFDALDLLEGMRLGGYDTLCSVSRTRNVVAGLRTSLPEPVAAVLLPKCDGALAALAGVQDEFFCRARISGGKMRVPGKSGDVDISLEDAAAQYLRLVRNSTHSFRAMATKDRRDKVLYACHSGGFDMRLPDLAFLHLLRIVNDPRILVTGVAKGLTRPG